MFYFLYFVGVIYVFSWMTHRAEMKEIEQREKEAIRRTTIGSRNGHRYLGTTNEGDDVFEGDIIEYDDAKCVCGHVEHNYKRIEASNSPYSIEYVHLVVAGE